MLKYRYSYTLTNKNIFVKNLHGVIDGVSKLKP